MGAMKLHRVWNFILLLSIKTNGETYTTTYQIIRVAENPFNHTTTYK